MVQRAEYRPQNRKLFGARLAYVLKELGVQQIELVNRLKGQFPHCSVSGSLVSRWLSGERDPSAYLAELASVLRVDLIQQLSLAQAAQEISDWYVLLGAEHLWRKALYESWFPALSPPLVAGNIPHLRLPEAYQRRPLVRDEIIARLLNIEPSSGKLRRDVVALVGLPGSGKSSMVLESLEKVRPFFQGGILYGDLRRQSPRQIMGQWCRGLRLDCPVTQALPWLAERLGENLRTRAGRFLIILENATDSRGLLELVVPEAWALITAYGLPPFQPLGWEVHSFHLPAFQESETMALLEQRLGNLWDRHSCTPKAREVHRLVEGLPMGAWVLAAVIRSRGWDFALDRLRDRNRALSVIQYEHGQTPSTSMALALDQFLPNLSRQAQALLEALSFLPLGESYPEALPELLRQHKELHLDNIDVEAAYYELIEYHLLNNAEGQGFHPHRLAALHVAQRMAQQKKAPYHASQD